MHILILLSTYNGEKYLREQLDSLYAQEGVDIHILARDDGSKDATVAILKDYRQRLGGMTILEGENCGARRSFFELIAYASENCDQYDYYAFCDQDDVWFKEKLISVVANLEKSSSTLKMGYTDLCTTDDKLTPLGNDGLTRHDNINLYSNIVSNHIAGCCMVFNKALLDKLNLINSDIVKQQPVELSFLHDSWTAAVAFALDAYVFHDNHPRMFYRQHGGNVVGNAQEGLASLYKKRIKRYAGRSTHSKSMKCKCIQLTLWDEIPEHNKQIISLCANYRGQLANKIRLLFDRRIYQYSFGENIGVFLLILLNKF